MTSASELLNVVNNKFSNHFKIKSVSKDSLVFEERCILNCFYCGKYNSNWKCPPHLPNLDYKKMFQEEYDNLAFLLLDLPFTEDNYDEIRQESSARLHRALLELEKYLWNNGNSTAVSFIGGSCKLCRNGCGQQKCNNPYMARSPLEATGMNVLKTAMNNGVNIQFPPDEFLSRLGLIAW